MIERFPTTPAENPEQQPEENLEEKHIHSADGSRDIEQQSHSEKEDFDVPETEKKVVTSRKEAEDFIRQYQEKYGDFHLVPLNKEGEVIGPGIQVRFANEISQDVFEGAEGVLVRINTNMRI